jgi:hypothetical protein
MRPVESVMDDLCRLEFADGGRAVTPQVLTLLEELTRGFFQDGRHPRAFEIHAIVIATRHLQPAVRYGRYHLVEGICEDLLNSLEAEDYWKDRADADPAPWFHEADERSLLFAITQLRIWLPATSEERNLPSGDS